MIADGPEATGTVPAVDIGSGDVLSRTGGGTVDDDGVLLLTELPFFRSLSRG